MEDLRQALRRHRLVAVLRGDEPVGVLRAGEVLAEAGVAVIEVTFTVPEASKVIRALRKRLPDQLVGAGTVATPVDVAAAVDSGAQFVVSPGTSPALLEAMLGCGVPALPGVLTPGEVLTARAAGAPAVKLFPAAAVGCGYLAQLFGPFPDLEVVPTGGIGLDDVKGWLGHGALAVGLSTALCSPADIRRHDWEAVTKRARIAVRHAEGAQ